ncbi:ABC transporter ATP-binding protein [Chloroflexota bacterium]
MEKEKGTLKLIRFFFSDYIFHIAALIILSLLIGGLEAATVIAVYPILSTVLDMGISQTGFLSIFGKLAEALPIEDKFVAFCLIFIVVTLLAFTARIININFRTRFSANLVKKNQNEIFKKFIRADYQYFIDHKQGDLIYNISAAPIRLSILVNSATDLLSQVVLSVSVILLLLALSWKGTLVVLAIGFGYHYATRYLGKMISYPAGKGEMEAVREGNVILNEAITGIKQVRVFANTDDWIDRFNSTIEKRWYQNMRQYIWQQVPPPALMLLLYVSIGVISMVIKVSSPVGFTTLIPLLGTFAFAVFKLSPIMSSAGTLMMQIMGALPDCEAVYHIQCENITQIKDGEKELSSFTTDIKFDNVTFVYKGRSKTLDDVSISFEKGKTTAIVGRSGVGKTTIVNLLLRLFDPSKGEIRIDRVNLKTYKLSSWLKNVGFVSQDTFILNDTVANNITFCADGYSREEITKAAKYADAHSFIIELPDGYDTFVGDKGMRLSGGQAQRIAVARAIIREPEVFIFDEATNNLDNISEAAVQKAIDEISKDHTVIAIAHRLSTIVNADKILVLDNGKVVEQGTHKQLLANKGAYWKLYSNQPESAGERLGETEDVD